MRTEDLGGPLPEGLVVHEVDLDTDPAELVDLVDGVGPDELYNLGGRQLGGPVVGRPAAHHPGQRRRPRSP